VATPVYAPNTTEPIIWLTYRTGRSLCPEFGSAVGSAASWIGRRTSTRRHKAPADDAMRRRTAHLYRFGTCGRRQVRLERCVRDRTQPCSQAQVPRRRRRCAHVKGAAVFRCPCGNALLISGGPPNYRVEMSLECGCRNGGLHEYEPSIGSSPFWSR
jgi:hypothetical protein